MPTDNHMFPQARNMSKPRAIQRTQRAQVVRRGLVLATLYQRPGEGLDEMRERARRMSVIYGGQVVTQ